MREVFRGCRKFSNAFSGFRNRGRHKKAACCGQRSDFPDSCCRILPLTTGKKSISLILTVGFYHSLRVKMAELYFLPYKATKIYGTGIEISLFGRSKLSISTGQHAILLISAVKACSDRRAGFRPERFSYVPGSK